MLDRDSAFTGSEGVIPGILSEPIPADHGNISGDGRDMAMIVPFI
jgi:hypothetical protein